MHARSRGDDGGHSVNRPCGLARLAMPGCAAYAAMKGGPEAACSIFL
ncbi:hypothetical protein [Pseudorhodoferax sp. Leaf267]